MNRINQHYSRQNLRLKEINNWESQELEMNNQKNIKVK